MSGRAPNPGERIPFAFAPHPRSLDGALRERSLSRDEYALLVALYARASATATGRKTWTVTVTLDQLGDLVAWEHSTDWLRKRLVALRDKGWIAYTTRPGVKRAAYSIRLLSEQSLSTESEQSLSTESGESGSASGIDGDRDESVSEHGNGREPRECLSTDPDSLSTDGPATPLPEPDSAPSRAEGVGASRDVRERANALTKERLRVERLGEQDHDGEETSRTSEPSRTDDEKLFALFEESQQERAERERRKQLEQFKAKEQGLG